MGGKKNKAKKQYIIKPSPKTSWPWSQLPQNLVQISLAAHKYFRSTTSGGTTKAWLTTTSRCTATTSHPHQLLRLINHASSNNIHSSTNNHLQYLDTNSSISSLAQGSTSGSVSYWCILKDDHATSRPPPSSTPPLDIGRAILTSVHLVGSSLMVCYSVHYNYRGKYVWSYNHVRVRHECATVDPFDSKKRYMEFTSVVRLERKFYALSVQGTLVVMQDVESRLAITSISTCRGVPSGTWRFFKHYLVELNGEEILLVFLIHHKSIQVVDKVEVFALDVVELEWIKVERIEGKTLFLDEKCIWSNSGEVGRGNCVYFTQGCDSEWWVYDMETRCILPA